jgi:hypothetical protein
LPDTNVHVISESKAVEVRRVWGHTFDEVQGQVR